MNITAKTKDDKIEIIFDDYFTIRDYNAVQRILEVLSKIRSQEEIK